jgi:hypothetical protein
MSANSESQAPRLFGAVLCAAASVLLLLSSLYLYAAGRDGGAVVPLLLFGLGLLLAALRSFRRR